jgi:hypothetical protein
VLVTELVKRMGIRATVAGDAYVCFIAFRSLVVFRSISLSIHQPTHALHHISRLVCLRLSLSLSVSTLANVFVIVMR